MPWARSARRHPWWSPRRSDPAGLRQVEGPGNGGRRGTVRVDLGGKLALVTGGSRGIGAALVRAMAEAGAAVVVNYRADETAARGVVEEIRGVGGDASLWQADVRDGQAVSAMIEGIVGRAGRLDIL